MKIQSSYNDIDEDPISASLKLNIIRHKIFPNYIQPISNNMMNIWMNIAMRQIWWNSCRNHSKWQVVKMIQKSISIFPCHIHEKSINLKKLLKIVSHAVLLIVISPFLFCCSINCPPIMKSIPHSTSLLMLCSSLLHVFNYRNALLCALCTDLEIN